MDITDVTQEQEIPFSYSVEWYAEDLKWVDRHKGYHANDKFVPATFEIHWLSIINSFVLVLLLTAFLTIIMLRVLKNDFSRYMEFEDEGIEEEEVGYKSVTLCRISNFYSPAGNSFMETSFVSLRTPACSVPLSVPVITCSSSPSVTCLSHCRVSFRRRDVVRFWQEPLYSIV